MAQVKNDNLTKPKPKLTVTYMDGPQVSTIWHGRVLLISLIHYTIIIAQTLYKYQRKGYTLRV